MKVVALISGGKDSCFNCIKCVKYGHEIVALANLEPPVNTDEMDSFMYQSVGHNAINVLGQCFDVPLIRRRISGRSVCQDLQYIPEACDEVEDLYELLKEVKNRFPAVTAVSSGAILSEYQRIRVENVCSRVGLVSLAYLWRREQSSLLREMIQEGVEAIIVKVAAMGLHPGKHLGKTLSQMEEELQQLSHIYGLNVCGEGGEYETLVLNCPLFKRRLVIDGAEVVMHSQDAFAPVAYLRITSCHVEDKEQHVTPLSALEPAAGSSELELAEEEVDTAPGASAIRFCTDPDDTPTSPAPVVPAISIALSEGGELYNLGSFRVADIALSQDGSVQEGTVEQATALFGLIQERLEQLGLGWPDVYFVHVFVKDMADFAAINAVYGTRFPVKPPSRSCVQLSGLHGRVMFEVQAARRCPRTVMHVQSISEWSSSCIGPYSQANQVAGCIFISGTIGLLPQTMQLVHGPQQQTQQALQNAERVLEAMGSSLHLLLYCSVYFVKAHHLPAIRHTVSEYWLHKGETAASHQIVFLQVDALPRGAVVEVEIAALHPSVGEPSDPGSDSDHDSGPSARPPAPSGPVQLQLSSVPLAPRGAFAARLDVLSGPSSPFTSIHVHIDVVEDHPPITKVDTRAAISSALVSALETSHVSSRQLMMCRCFHHPSCSPSSFAVDSDGVFPITVLPVESMISLESGSGPGRVASYQLLVRH